MDFPNTNWTILASATANGDDAGQEALNDLCRSYWQPVSNIIRSRGAPSEKVEDLTQEFFIQLIDKQFFKRAERDKGKFRSFMLGSLRNFLSDDYKKQMSQRRGGHLQQTNLDEVGIATEDEELRFDQSWARAIFHRALERVEHAILKKKPPEIWEELRNFLPGSKKEAAPYAELAQTLSLSEGGAKKDISRLRQSFREALRTEVSLTVSAPHEVDEELAHLRAMLERNSTAI